MINKKILNYITIRSIGKGGMAEVFVAKHQTFEDRKVAIKILDPLLARKENIARRFMNEAKIMAKLEHPNIVKVIDFENNAEMLAIVMELLAGKNLSEYIHPKGKLQKDEAIKIFKQALSAFDFAHKQNVVHRDVKPSNIFIETAKGNNVKILDFGIAKLLESDANDTNTGAQMGTPLYMSPEQVKDSKHIDQRSDIYSLGVVLYYMLAGKPPYDTTSLSNFEIFNKIVFEPVPELPEYPNINELIKKATAKNPADRFQTCKEFAEALSGDGNFAKVQNFGKVEKTDSVVSSHTDSNNDDKTEIEVNEYIEDATQIETDEHNQATVIDAIDVELPKEISKLIDDMSKVESGTFKMGSNDRYDGEKPVHKVAVSSFNIGKYEVTQAQWKAVMGNNPSYFKGDSLPVETVSWDDIQIFIKKLNQMTGKTFRLPTEAEWEYAARGGENYKYAGSSNLDEVAWYMVTTNDEGTKFVGTKKPNGYGLYDMSGNVWEWCSDWYDKDYYKNSPTKNPQGASNGSYRVNRGGSWVSYDSSCRSANRGSSSHSRRNSSIGFRLVFVP